MATTMINSTKIERRESIPVIRAPTTAPRAIEYPEIDLR